MKITSGLAQPIVDKLMALLQYNVNIMDDRGIIVASGDPQRIGQQHEGALKVLRSNQPLMISEQDARVLYGAKPGVNLPIEFEGQVLGVVCITGNLDEVYKFGTIIKMNVEVLLQQIHLNRQLEYRKRPLDNWIAELIAPGELAEKKLRKTAASLELDVDLPRSVLLVEIEELKWGDEMVSLGVLQRLNERKEQMLADLRMLVEYRSIFAYLEDGIFFIALPAEETMENRGLAKLEEHLCKQGYRFFIGIGGAGKGLSGYRESFSQAQQSVRLMKQFGRENRSVHIREWGIIPCLDAVPEQARHRFLNLHQTGRPALTEESKQTLEAYMENELDVREAAARLHIHRNTLLYRLDKISRQFDLDYRKFNDLLILKLMLAFDRLQDKPGAAGSSGKGGRFDETQSHHL